MMMRGIQKSACALALAVLIPAAAPGVASAGSILAQVKTLDLKPASGASVKLFNASGTQLLQTRTTDSRGVATFSNVPVGKYRVQAFKKGIGVDLVSAVVLRPNHRPDADLSLMKDRPGVFRGVGGYGYFFLDRGEIGYDGELPIQFGLASDQPIAGDWNGDGKDEVGVYRNGLFYLDTGPPGYQNEQPIAFGLPGDQPIAGDWNGDGKDEVGVYRNGLFYLDTGPPGYQNEQPIAFGLPGDRPVAGDWNNDGKDEVGVYRNGKFYLRGFNNGNPVAFGLPGDFPFAGHWTGTDRSDKIGVFRNGWFFRDRGLLGWRDEPGEEPIQLGLPGDRPVIGNWGEN